MKYQNIFFTTLLTLSTLVPTNPVYARVSCKDFSTQQQAQQALANGATQLDRDKDGIACESLPRGNSQPQPQPQQQNICTQSYIESKGGAVANFAELVDSGSIYSPGWVKSSDGLTLRGFGKETIVVIPNNKKVYILMGENDVWNGHEYASVIVPCPGNPDMMIMGQMAIDFIDSQKPLR